MGRFCVNILISLHFPTVLPENIPTDTHTASSLNICADHGKIDNEMAFPPGNTPFARTKRSPDATCPGKRHFSRTSAMKMPGIRNGSARRT